MRITKLAWRNFSSYGNKLQELDLDEPGMKLLIGENGAGKSTISDVVIFSLYGKLPNKKQKDIVNRFNNNLYTKIELEHYNSHIVIERGVTPNFINLTVNGKPYDVAGKRNIEDYLEEEIFKIPFYVYTNLITLSINDFQSFITMGAKAKRDLIDKIFSLQIINVIRTLIREEIRKTSEDAAILSNEIDALEITIQTSEKELTKLKKQIEINAISEKQETLKNIENYNKNLEELAGKLKEIGEKYEKAEDKIQDLNEMLTTNKQKKKGIEEKKLLYENQKCPLCQSDLETDFHKHLLKGYLDEEMQINENIEATKTSIESYKKVRNQIGTMITKMNSKKSEFTTLISNFNKKLKELDNLKDNSMETNSIEKIINESRKRKVTTTKKKDNTVNKTNFFKILEDIYSESGVKQLALQKILPTLNSEIRKVMIDLKMDYKVVFNINFDAEISHLGYEVSAQQISTGEKKKIDFAILIALIRLMKIKFPTINMMFLDELFSSIDQDGIFHIIQVLAQSSKELGLSIFVVNHSPLPEELFDYKIEAKKVNNFSSLNIEKLN